MCCKKWQSLASIPLYIYLGAGKHPSPLEKPKTISPNDYLTVGFYRIKKYCSDQKLLRFKDCSTRTSVTSCQPPIYLGAGKHPSPLEKPKTISPNDYLTVGFYRIKKYCSDQKLLRFKDCSTRTSVTSCQPPIYRYFQRVHIWVLASTRALLKNQKLLVLMIT